MNIPGQITGKYYEDIVSWFYWHNGKLKKIKLATQGRLECVIFVLKEWKLINKLLLKVHWFNVTAVRRIFILGLLDLLFNSSWQLNNRPQSWGQSWNYKLKEQIKSGSVNRSKICALYIKLIARISNKLFHI